MPNPWGERGKDGGGRVGFFARATRGRRRPSLDALRRSQLCRFIGSFQVLPLEAEGEERGIVRAFRQWFMNYGLVASIFVSTALVAVLAYRLEGSRWRWPMVALALAGLGTIAGILWIRRYIDRQPKAPDQEVK